MHIVVIGGGVAGAACAIALLRTGAQVTVVEAHPEHASGDPYAGSFLSLASNGLRALDVLGALEAVRAGGVELPRQRLWSGRGILLGDLPRGRLENDPLVSITLLRGRLVEELRVAAVRAGARFRFGRRLTDLDVAGDGVTARFADGSGTHADLVVGADGIWSTARGLLDPASPSPAYGGLFHVSGTAEGVDDVEPGVFDMVFCRAGAFVSLTGPDERIWWSAQVADRVAPDPDTVDLARLARAFRHDPGPARILAAATTVQRPTPQHVLPAVRTWHDDRIVLVGDAAHPVGAGQGASMAIEDAVVLAQRLTLHETLPAALADYDTVRRPRVASMVRTAAQNRDAKTAGAFTGRARDVVMPFFLRHFYARSTAWLYTHELGELPSPTPEVAEESLPPATRGGSREAVTPRRST